MGEIGGSPEPASPNPLEIIMMGLLKTNGKMLILS